MKQKKKKMFNDLTTWILNILIFVYNIFVHILGYLIMYIIFMVFAHVFLNKLKSGKNEKSHHKI